MSADEPTAKGFSLERWSKRKLEAARAAPEPAAAPAATSPPPADVGASQPAIARAVGASGSQTAVAPASDVPALPPVESLTFDSDFAAFLQPKVDEALKRQALKQLFRDPRFNVMDGLDVYIDDYSKPDPISPELVRQLVQGRYIFDPPATRVNERGEVEDVPPEEAAVAGAEGEPPPLTDAGPATLTEVGSATLPEAAPGASPDNAPARLAEAAPVVQSGAGADVVPENADAPVVAMLPPQPEQRVGALPLQPQRPDAALPAQRERPDSTDSTPR